MLALESLVASFGLAPCQQRRVAGDLRTSLHTSLLGGGFLRQGGDQGVDEPVDGVDVGDDVDPLRYSLRIRRATDWTCTSSGPS